MSFSSAVIYGLLMGSGLLAIAAAIWVDSRRPAVSPVPADTVVAESTENMQLAIQNIRDSFYNMGLADGQLWALFAGERPLPPECIVTSPGFNPNDCDSAIKAAVQAIKDARR